MADVADMDVDDPNQLTVAEELLQIIEDFAEYIDKFMFEIVTFLAVIDSSMGLIKDVLGMFGFSGWKMTFFPTFSFIVTIGVFLFGTNKRKGKRQAEAAELEGLGQAMDMLDDVLEVVDDVADEIEKVESQPGGLGLGAYSDSDEDDEENLDKTEIKDTKTADFVVDIEDPTDGKKQEPSQQESEAPPKSSISKVVGMVIMVAGIVAKLSGKSKRQETESLENNEEKIAMDNASFESQNSPANPVTGVQAPPTDIKSKFRANTCTSNTAPQDDTLVEITTDFKQESIEVATALRNDGARATTIVKEGTIKAGNVVHDTTIQALETTGALKVGNGLYREVDFISGHLKREGIAAGKSLEIETDEVVKHVNKVVKVTGIDKIANGVSREAAFLGENLSQGTKTAIQNDENIKSVFGKSLGRESSLSSAVHRESNPIVSQKGDTCDRTQDKEHRLQTKGPTNHGQLRQNTSNSLTAQLQKSSTRSSKQETTSRLAKTSDAESADIYTKPNTKPFEANGSHVVQESAKQVLASTGALKVGNGLYREADFIYGLVKKEGIAAEKEIESETEKVVNSLKECRAVQETGADKLVTGVYRQASYAGDVLSKETRSFIEVEKQNLDNLVSAGPSGVILDDLTVYTSQQDKLACNQNKAITSEVEVTKSIAEPLSSKPQQGTSDMASSVMEGAAEATGSLNNKAKQGIKQTQVKSKGLLPIVMRLIRLIVRVVSKNRNSTANPQASSSPASVASNSGDSQEHPPKGKRTAEGEGDAANVASAAASAALGAVAGGGAKGGKISAVVGVIVRLVRLANKLRKGNKDSRTASERKTSKKSHDQESDDEFFDCGEEFLTTEIETQTDEMYLLSVATQTPDPERRLNSFDQKLDVGTDRSLSTFDESLDADESLDVDIDGRRSTFDKSLNFHDSMGVLTEETLSEELKSIAYDLQAFACENAAASLHGLADRLQAVGSGQTPFLQDGCKLKQLTPEDNCNLNDCHKNEDVLTLSKEEDERKEPVQHIALDSSNQITLQILPSPSLNSGRTERSGSIVIDFGGPAIVRPNHEHLAGNPHDIIEDDSRTTPKQIQFHKRVDESLYQTENDQFPINCRGGIEKESKLTRDVECPSDCQGETTSTVNNARHEVFVDMHAPRSKIPKGQNKYSGRNTFSNSYYKDNSPLLPNINENDLIQRKNRSHTADAISSPSSKGVNLTLNPIVQYDSSSEDLSQENLFLQKRRRSVVRFEDECRYEPSQSVRSVITQEGTPL